MEPRIQYAKTSDGVSIAFWTLGESGVPLVQMPVLGYSHVQLEWQIPEWRLWYERLAEKRKLIRYDGRESGLSERRVADFSMDAQVLDLKAVVDRLGLEGFALMGAFTTGPAAIAYAVRHPERVSHLLLWCAWSRGSDYLSSPRAHALRSLRQTIGNSTPRPLHMLPWDGRRSRPVIPPPSSFENAFRRRQRKRSSVPLTGLTLATS